MIVKWKKVHLNYSLFLNNLIYNLSCILVSAILYKNDETNKKLLYLKI